MNGKFKDQDEYLDEMGNIASRLKAQINNINAEVNTQTSTISEIDRKLAKTLDNMNTINGQLTNLKDAIGT